MNSTTHCPKLRDRPSSGLIDQRLVPMLISLVESYCPRGNATATLTPTMPRWLIRGKLLGGHGRGPIEVHRQLHSGIPLAEPANLGELTEIEAFQMPGHHRHHHSGVGRSSGQAERPRKRQCRGVDPGARVIDGRGRIERQIAPVEPIGRGKDVQPLGKRPIRAGLELLPPHTCWHQEESQHDGSSNCLPVADTSSPHPAACFGQGSGQPEPGRGASDNTEESAPNRSDAGHQLRRGARALTAGCERASTSAETSAVLVLRSVVDPRDDAEAALLAIFKGKLTNVCTEFTRKSLQSRLKQPYDGRKVTGG